jgi:DNA-binding response OmpR family regulator
MDKDKIILVVEDEKPLAVAVSAKLKKKGFQVVTARAVDQAKNYVTDLARIDAIWLDHYLLGKEDGLDFVAWCKGEENKKFKNIPIFVVSNTASPDKVSSYLSLGVKDYYIKANYKLEKIIEDIAEKLGK